jgi:heat shock protein HtpX
VYIVFLSVLVYVGLDFISITMIASIMILAQWYFSDRLVLLIYGAKKVTREQFPELHDMIERIIARNNLPKLQIAVTNIRLPNAFATGRSPKSSSSCNYRSY